MLPMVKRPVASPLKKTESFPTHTLTRSHQLWRELHIWGHVDVCGPCCHRGLCMSLWFCCSHVDVHSHEDVPDLCCCLKPCWFPWPLLLPRAVSHLFILVLFHFLSYKVLQVKPRLPTLLVLTTSAILRFILGFPTILYVIPGYLVSFLTCQQIRTTVHSSMLACHWFWTPLMFIF